MKQSEKIWDIWESGFYAGSSRPHARVTVEKDWYLNLTGNSRVYGSTNNGPFRWYQNADNSQVETEVPNIQSIGIDRSIDTDVGTCKISMYNQKMTPNIGPVEAAEQLGYPGFYSWGRGKSPEAVARWNQATNEWEDVIVPNALLRTYEGFGGYDSNNDPLPLEQAIEEGYITLTGVWLVDSVSLNSSGMINLDCRDIGKLLLVQQMFPPLIPNALYKPGLELCRWQYTSYVAKFAPRKPFTVGGSAGGPLTERAPSYYTSSADAWYGFNASIHGHSGSDSVDGDPATFAMSVGNSHPDRAFCTDYWEYEVNSQITEVYVHTWGGNYTMYISVLENGVWSSNGEGLIPYDYSSLVGTQPTAVDTGAAIPYVMRTGTAWETGAWYQLPRYFNAQRIRISFRDHMYTDLGPWQYRCGIREVLVKAQVPAGSPGITYPPPLPWTYAAAPYRNPASVVESGYWVAADDGQVFAFGDARTHALNSPYAISDAPIHAIFAMSATPSGNGYWLLQTNGSVYAYGDATFYGDMKLDVFFSGKANCIDMAVTPTGQGYWILRRDGTVTAFGDAVDHGDMTYSVSGIPQDDYKGTGIESHPSIAGYWLVNGDGRVEAFGGVPSLGSLSPLRTRFFRDEWVPTIRRTSTGNGYWVLGGGAHVYPFGDATSFGEGIPETTTEFLQATGDHAFRHITWDIIPSPSDEGYMLLKSNGELVQYGSVDFFGNPGGEGQLRKDGNYQDYADIVKLILGWSGFTLKYDSPPDTGNFPPIYGNIEYTGAFADECLDPSIFDKRPPIDCINELKEIVGYIFFVDSEGAAHFESPNWWSVGNFWEDGSPTDFVPEVDERLVQTNYSVSYSDESARSEIIIATEDPTESNTTTITTRLIPESASVLRGMIKPAMWTNGVFSNKDEQQIMAELIAMHIWFQQRLGDVECVANPCIQINDQVRIFERTTSESYIHYVRAVSSSHNLDDGTYTMNLTTHWLGDEENWVLTKENIPGRNGIVMSEALRAWLDKSPARTIQVARMNDFGTLDYPSTGQLNPPDLGGIGAATV